jgi:hypothetical protein
VRGGLSGLTKAEHESDADESQFAAHDDNLQGDDELVDDRYGDKMRCRDADRPTVLGIQCEWPGGDLPFSWARGGPLPGR